MVFSIVRVESPFSGLCQRMFALLVVRSLAVVNSLVENAKRILGSSSMSTRCRSFAAAIALGVCARLVGRKDS